MAAPTRGTHVVPAAAAGQAGLGAAPVADHGGVDVAVAVHRRAAQEAVIHVTRLAGQHHVVHAGGRRGLMVGPRVAHRDGQGRHARSDAARLEDDQQARGVGPLRQHPGHDGKPRPHKSRAAILQQAGGHAGQQFRQVVTRLLVITHRSPGLDPAVTS